ncbi:MAG: SCO family protein, partial [Leifsonia sp.]
MPETNPPVTPVNGSTSRRFRLGLWSAAGAVVAAGITVALIVVPGAAQASHEVEPGIDQTSAILLQLDDIRSDHLTAPAYALTDQNGKPMTAAEFHGRSVVLTVNDDQCEDLCTLLAQDIATADHDLGAAAKHVAFVSINANPYYPQVSAVRAWSDQHGLGKLKNWYFGTGTSASLSAIWKSYGVPVELDPKDKTVVHGAEIFFIDPSGKEVALGQFGTESANTAPFAHTMAQMAVDALPSADRSPVGGPSLPAATTGGTQVGA